MKFNRKLLPIKAHYFFFMAAMGPILPFVVVVAKQFGISEVMFGTINALLPLLYFATKPLYGFLIDYFNRVQILIYTASIAIMALCFILMYVPSYMKGDCLSSCEPQVSVNVTNLLIHSQTTNNSYELCNGLSKGNCSLQLGINRTICGECKEYGTLDSIYSIEFLVFVSFMCIGLVLFNICSSITDAICFNIMGEGNEMMYGRQRVWGSVGYGLTAFTSGYLIDQYSGNSAYKDHTVGFIIFVCFMLADILICVKLNPSRLDKPVNILKSTLHILNDWKVGLFISITFIFGVCDGFAIYYLYWYLEDIASTINMTHIIRSIEGMTTLIQTFFGEVIFFNYSGIIVEKIGYDASFILCYFAYFVRFVLMSMITNIWLVLPIEAVMQGLSYALSYTLIVSYTSLVSSPGVEATMQSLVTAVYDCVGYALGSFAGGILYKTYGGRTTFFIFSMVALFCALCYILACIISKLTGKEFGIVPVASKAEVVGQDDLTANVELTENIGKIDDPTVCERLTVSS